MPLEEEKKAGKWKSKRQYCGISHRKSWPTSAVVFANSILSWQWKSKFLGQWFLICLIYDRRLKLVKKVRWFLLPAALFFVEMCGILTWRYIEFYYYSSKKALRVYYSVVGTLLATWTAAQEMLERKFLKAQNEGKFMSRGRSLTQI